MDKMGHEVSGLLLGVGLVPCALGTGMASSAADSVLILSAAVAGAGAPDWLELSSYRRSAAGDRFVRVSAIPHRTYTHWWPFWVLPALGMYWAVEHLAGFCFLVFLLSGLLHIVSDWPNPSGIPLLSPTAPRHSLRLWKSGERNLTIYGVLACFAAVCWLAWLASSRLGG